VEVVRGEKSSDDTVSIIYRMAETLGKVPVVINKDIPGFASNRLQYAVFREALHLVAEGIVSIQDVDRTLKCGVGFRYPWLGALETVDLGGLDLFHTIASENLFRELSTMTKPPEFFTKLVAEGHLGIKTGKGFYDYAGKSREDVLRKRDLYFIRQLKLIREVQGE
jgi:3-hydroxybutyryl-CoA dehydrogenase